jgi:hypothetical protein
MAGRFDGMVWLRKSDTGVQLRRVTDKAPAPKGASTYNNANINALLERIKAAKLPLAPYSCFIPGVSPTGDNRKAVAHTIAQIEAAMRKGLKPVLCYSNFGGASLMLLEDKPLQKRIPAGRKAKPVEFL